MSIHQVMRAEKLLKGEEVAVDLIPVPREISSDCGVAIELPAELKDEALRLFEKHHMPILKCFTKNQRGEFEKGRWK